MISFEDAKGLVNDYLRKEVSEESVIIEDAIVEKKYGWIFSYNTKKYLETGNVLYSLAGNGLIIILKENGTFIALESGIPSEESIQKFERDNGLDI